MVVQDDDLECAGLRLAQTLLRVFQLPGPNPAGLVTPGADRVEPDHMQGGGRVGRLGGLPLPLELVERPREAGRERVRDVVIPGNRQDRALEGAEKGGRTGELIRLAAVTQIAAGDHELWLEAFDQHRCAVLDRLVVSGAVMQVRKV